MKRLPSTLGPYRLTRLVGSGGMADVYLATHETIGGFERLVCLKCVREDYIGDAEIEQALVDEARVTSYIDHPNVTQIYELGRVGEDTFIAMEFVAGTNAAELLKVSLESGFNLPVDVVLYIAAEAARGLDAAHRETNLKGEPLNLVHRDISPQNILISFDGAVKVSDFGIAKSRLRHAHTTAGIVKGKYRYLSPEQARGETLDARSDVFALGIVLFELLTGTPFLRAEEPEALVREAQSPRTPRVHRTRDSVPKEVNGILQRSLKRKAGKRYPSAQALSDALSEALLRYFPDFEPARVAEIMRFFFPEHWALVLESREPTTLATSRYIADFSSSHDVELTAVATGDARPGMGRALLLGAGLCVLAATLLWGLRKILSET